LIDPGFFVVVGYSPIGLCRGWNAAVVLARRAWEHVDLSKRKNGAIIMAKEKSVVLFTRVVLMIQTN